MQHNFTLQSVLDYRGTIVDSLEMELALMLREKIDLENAINKAARLEKQLWNELLELRVGELDLVRMEHLQNQQEQVEKEKELLLSSLKSLMTQIHAKREEIVLAKQDEEVLETIKEKEIRKFKQRVKEQDQKFQDDIYIAQAYQARAV